MPSLKELVTNLSTFRYYSGVGTFSANTTPYGKDVPGGGSSGQPYIKRSPGQSWGSGLIGGITHTAADTLRISKFFLDAPTGPAFLLKQTGLQMMNPILESSNDLPVTKPTTGQGLFMNTSNFISNTANRIVNELGTTRVYNPLGVNTLAQVAGSAIGTHLTRHGLLPTTNDDINSYTNMIREKDKKGANRLVGLAAKFADQKQHTFGPIVISKYAGGPGSVLGVGTTTIKSTGATTSLTGNASNNPLYAPTLGGFIPLGVDYIQKIDKNGMIPKQTSTHDDGHGNFTTTTLDEGFDFRLGDFREYKNKLNVAGGTALPFTNYAKYNIPKRIGIINKVGKYSNRYQNNPNDKVNMLSLFYGDGKEPSSMTGKDVNDNPVTNDLYRDLIKFRLKILDNDNPNYGTYIIFRAFFNGEIAKDITAKWSPYAYVGRGEQFYAYENTTAVMTFSFTIVAFSGPEMRSLYQKLNFLESSMYPDYKGNKMRGNITELTIGDYIKYQPGIINTMNVSIPEDSNWEIAMTEPEKGSDSIMHELPHMLKVSLTFTPIYNFLPRKNSQTPFIGIDDLEGGNKGPKNWLKNAVEPATTPTKNTTK